MESFNGERVAKLEENGYELIERLQHGEKVLCDACRKGYYITSAKNISQSKEFSCEKCGNILRISPNVIVD